VFVNRGLILAPIMPPAPPREERGGQICGACLDRLWLRLVFKRCCGIVPASRREDPPVSVTIFISTVTAEFQIYRDGLRRDLARHDVEVKVQEDFKPHGLATLEQLDLYIARCDLVVHFVGDMVGSDANEVRSVARILKMHPDLVDELPPLREAFEKGESLSYTQ
jgi:hypothetical protein